MDQSGESADPFSYVLGGIPAGELLNLHKVSNFQKIVQLQTSPQLEPGS